MILTAATPGTLALFDDGEYAEPVLAWDDEGYPLVLGPDDRLVRAQHRDGFESINADAPAPPTTIPAGPGWWVIVRDDVVNRWPVVAWQIDHHGYGEAVAAIGSRLRPARQVDGFLVFYDPDLAPVRS